jgi:hypothetical protein
MRLRQVLVLLMSAPGSDKWIGLRSRSNFSVLLVVLGMLCSLLPACQPLSRTLAPTPQVIRVQYTPSLKDWTGALSRCAANLPLIGLVVDEVPAGHLDLSQSDLVLRFGSGVNDPPNAFIIGYDEVVMVMNLQNPAVNLASDLVMQVYEGKLTSWKDLTQGMEDQAVHAWTYLPEDDLRQVFDAAFLNGSSASKQLYLAPNTDAMLEAVVKDPYAIGYLYKSQLNQSIRQLPVIGMIESSLRQPVLGFTNGEPGENLRQLLLCLQKP